MPFAAAAPIIASLVGGGLGIAGGMINGKPKTSTQSTAPTLTPEMQQLQQRLSQFSQGEMDNPGAGIAPIRNAGLDNINRSFMNVGSRVSSSLASRGYGSSGDMGNSLYKTEIARGGAMSDFEGMLAQIMNSNRNHGADLGAQLLNSGKGSTSTGTGPDTSLSDGLLSAGNGLNDLGGHIGNISNITTLLTLSKLLKGDKSGVTGDMPAGYTSPSIANLIK